MHSRPLATALLALAIALTPTVTASAASGGSINPRSGSVQAPVVRVAVAGDSTTAMLDSWRAELSKHFHYRFVGYAHSGYTSAQVLARIRDEGADVLVVKVGVNDFRLGLTAAKVLANIRSIVARVHAKHVIVSAIVPSDSTDFGKSHLDRRAMGAQFNALLPQFAAQYGWAFIDPDSGFRLGDNGYLAGTTKDGVHPDTASYRLEASVIGNSIDDAMRRVVTRGSDPRNSL